MQTDPQTTALPLTPSPATADDAADILALRHRLVDWMEDRGINQWRHDDVSQGRVLQQAEEGQWWLIRSGAGNLAAAIRIVNQDIPIWGRSDRRAIYVHGLMVDRRCAGQNLGGRFLAWAAEHGRCQGAEALRLDCVATNRDLCNYYLRHGFSRVGTRELSARWGVAALFEQAI